MRQDSAASRGMPRVMDSTLQDGGYINGWNFGYQNILETVSLMEQAGIDFIDVGSYQDKTSSPDSSFFSSIEELESRSKRMKKSKPVLTLRVDWSSSLDGLNFNKLLKLGYVVRVQFDHTNQQKALKYCLKLSKAGIPLIIHPLVSKYYSEDEFTSLVKLYGKFSPIAFYIDDYQGIMKKDALFHYIDIIRDTLPESDVGIRSRANIEQMVEELASKYDRIILDSTICGIGVNGLFNAKTESIVEYLDELGGKYLIDPLITIVDRHLRSTCQKYGTISLLRGLRKYAAFDPMIMDECSTKMKIWDYELVQLFEKIKEDDFYSKKMVDVKLREIRSSYWRKKLCVVIPTYKRVDTVRYYLETCGKRLFEYGIDMYILDSSPDDEIKKLILQLNANGYTNITYNHYESADSNTLDYKIIDAYLDYTKEYEYVWICRDGLVITFDFIHTQLEQIINKQFDLIVVDSDWRDIKKIGYREYESPTELFKDHCIRMVTLGTMIVSSDFINNVIKEVPVDETNYSLWQVISVFQYYEKHPVNAVSYSGPVFAYNPYGLITSFWNTNGKALWQWADRWYDVIKALPTMYDEYKPEVLKIKMYDFDPFGYRQLLILRCTGSLTLRKYAKYKKNLSEVTDTKISHIFLISITPKWICKKYLDSKGGVVSTLLKIIWDKCS